MQEQEKGKVSGSDEEGEGPLEQAVRKVVSYKMTPKQALQIYNLTPKVSNTHGSKGRPKTMTDKFM